MSTAVLLRLIVLLLCVALHLSPITARQQTRRILHQPFFPQDSSPPSQPPSFSPQPQQQQQQQQQQPKLPFSSSSSQSPPQAFFPFYHTPPPPTPATALATFPANISSLLLPQPTSHPHSHILAIAVSASLLSAALFAALAAFLFYRKNRAVRFGGKISRTDSLGLYPPNIATSDGGFKARRTLNTSSEFLYLGTLVNSRGIYEENGESGCGGGIPIGASATPNRNLGSPELKPLPPLARHQSLQEKYRYGELGSVTNELEDDAEEFFSPRGSSGGKGNLSRTGSSSRRMFQNVEAEKHGTRSFNLKTSSYPSSYSGSPTLSASNSPSMPLIMSPSSLNSKSPDSVIIFPAPLRPLPARPIISTSLASSSSSSPSHKDSGNTKNSPARKSDSSVPEMPLQTGDTAAVEPSPAPPPPPPPPRKLWEIPAPANLTKEPNLRPPVLLTPSRPAGFQNFAPISSSDQLSDNTMAEGSDETPKPKLKPLHWDKVRASSDRAMVWDQIKSSSFQLNEEMIETLFMANNPNSTQKDNVRRSVIPSPNQENWVLDSKKSQNIAILLRALNVTADEVCEALLEGNADSLGAELLESLLKMAPTKEEEIKLREFKDESPFKLGSAEKFLKAVLDIPFAFRRIDAVLYLANFDSEIEYLKRSFDTLEAACEELKTSRMFLKLLEAVLKTGNRMNVGTNRGDAHAFKLDTLLKLVDIKGADGKTTLLHFVVQEIIKAEGFRLSGSNQRATIDNNQPSSLTDDVRLKKLGLQVVSGLSGELSNVKKAAAMDSETLRNEASKLVGGIEKIEDVVKLNEEIALKTNSWKFSESMKEFLCKAEEEIIRTQAQESVALSMVKEVTEYFHGNSAMEEAHPLRIFTIVRDFLAILDQVCKEVGKINERAIMGSTRLFPVPVNPTLAPAFPGRQHSGSSEDESSSMSSPYNLKLDLD